MVVERFKELGELFILVLVEIELLFRSVRIHETMKNWDGLSI